MSAREFDGPEPGQDTARSSVKITRNASGKVQLEVKVRCGDTAAAVEEVSAVASKIYDALAAKYGRDG